MFWIILEVFQPLSLSRRLKEFSGLVILFNYQGSCHLLSGACLSLTAYLLYHVFLTLSSTFFNFFWKPWKSWKSGLPVRLSQLTQSRLNCLAIICIVFKLYQLCVLFVKRLVHNSTGLGTCQLLFYFFVFFIFANLFFVFPLRFDKTAVQWSVSFTQLFLPSPWKATFIWRTELVD